MITPEPSDCEVRGRALKKGELSPKKRSKNGSPAKGDADAWVTVVA